jgi:LysR family nitrogen assimilation transcriptional regulator
MDLRQLSYFVKVSELGSFTKAAQIIGTGQPALSRQIRALEIEFGQSLLIRNGRGALPTEAGQRLLKHARDILYQVESMREDLSSGANTLGGRVIVGLPPSLARILAVPLSKAFSRSFPKGKLAIVESLSSNLISGIREGRLDIAIIYESKLSPDIELETLFEERLSVMCPTGARLAQQISVEDLSALNLIIPSRPNAIRLQVEAALNQYGLKPHVVLEIDGVSAILDLVESGAGFAILPPYAIKADARTREIRTIQIKSPGIKISVSIATSAKRMLTETQRATGAIMKEVIGECLYCWETPKRQSLKK